MLTFYVTSPAGLMGHCLSSYSRTHYETLGLQKQASGKEIRAAYIQLCKKYHPDANPGDPQSQQNFVQLQEAYSILTDPKKRADYDVQLNRNNFRTNRTEYTRSTGYRSEDDFVQSYYQQRARQQRTGDMYNDLYDEMIRKSEEARRKAYGEYYRDQNSKQKAYEDFYKNQERRRREFENIYKEYYQYQSPGYMRGNPRSDYSRKQQYHPHPYTSPFGNFLFTFIWLYIAIKILMSLVWSNGHSERDR
ncbi:chaperone protein DnaJ-like isoform X2 [Ostrea edulis]|uniref:chaperone protein DnaJ-like isoform X2 n=1 Tax=Ostrea edulis TaxID=37623 RepID=UPI0024AF02D2|nr:chaperone protein DnaJ-like isoform X2 [Ostrea edulis]XP_056023031.1 chaperone protein DnaJ-like isoform X2 [Ostrea edulis]